MEKLTRRNFLITASAATLAAAASPSLFASSGRQRVFVGGKAPDGILAFDWNPATAELIPAGVAAKLGNVEWITFSADHQYLFAAAAVDGFNGRVLHSRAVYRIGQGTGLACNSSIHADLIPMVSQVTCNNQGIWQPSLPKCFGKRVNLCAILY